MRKIQSIALFAGILLLVSCQKESVVNNPGTTSSINGELVSKTTRIEVPTGNPLSKTRLDELVKETYITKGDFRWEMLDFHAFWSATQYGDQSVAIGYKPAQVGDIADFIEKINIQEGAWKEVHDRLLAFIQTSLEESTGKKVNLSDILVEDDQVLPIITLKLTDAKVLTELYNLENVRYLEPLDYFYGESASRSTSGCSASSQSLNNNDYTTVTPNAKLSWNYNNVNIPAAWNTAQGQGITIGVIDAGISSSQTLLGSAFNNGDSNVGRTLTTDYTFGSSAYTSCTHGTSMCGLAAGPRNNFGATTGTAYKSNIHFIRACEDVMLDLSSERTGVKNALVKMGDRADVKVVSMSIGTPFYSSVLEDGVNYAHNKGKMLMAAAGTSFSWLSWWGVVYPAAHNKCVAITGVKENFSTCASCHDGPEVDFTVTMERNNNSSRNALSLAASGYSPKYIGGSSAATAMAAGIAATVWSVNANMTREQVLNYLTITSQYYPNPNSDTGYGNLNAGAAVNAAMPL
jgi:serine protease